MFRPIWPSSAVYKIYLLYKRNCCSLVMLVMLWLMVDVFLSLSLSLSLCVVCARACTFDVLSVLVTLKGGMGIHVLMGQESHQ
jgi:hypothetical protein